MTRVVGCTTSARGLPELVGTAVLSLKYAQFVLIRRQAWCPRGAMNWMLQPLTLLSFVLIVVEPLAIAICTPLLLYVRLLCSDVVHRTFDLVVSDAVRMILTLAAFDLT